MGQISHQRARFQVIVHVPFKGSKNQVHHQNGKICTRDPDEPSCAVGIRAVKQNIKIEYLRVALPSIRR